MRTPLVVAASALVLLASLPGDVMARPVPVGRYTEIPYGISADHPWSTGGGGPHRRGRSELRAPSEAPSQQWERRIGVGQVYPPAIAADGTLYVASREGIASLTPAGEVQWHLRVGLTSGTPSITPEGHLIVGTQGAQVLRIAPQGRILHRTAVGGGVRGSPLVLPDGSVVVGAFDRAVHRFDADGRRLFRRMLPAEARAAAAWDGRRTILLPAGSQVLFLSPRGEVLARAALGEEIVAGPAVGDDGTVWVLTDDGALHALGPRGRVRARTELEGSVSLSTQLVVGADGAVRIGTRDMGLVCVGPNGTERWRLTSEGAFTGGIVVDAAGTTLAVNQQGRLYAVGPDGRIRWRVYTGTRTDAAPVIGPNGTLYLSTLGGSVRAWR